MRRTKALIAGASALAVLGLSACSSAEKPPEQQNVLRALQADLQDSSSATPTPDPIHQQIKDQLNRIEDKVTPRTVTKTVTRTTTVATATKTVTKTVTASPAPPPPNGGDLPAPPPVPTGLGVGGVATPSNATIHTGSGHWTIKESDSGIGDAPHIYDCKGATVGWLEIQNANNIIVQNCVIDAQNHYGILSEGENIVIQNNDIKGLKAPGDINAITFFGSGTKILSNTFINGVVGNPGDSHTDFIQTWVSTSHPRASANVRIAGNKAVGPANPDRKNSVPSIHQSVMAEGKNCGGNSGGNGDPHDWIIADNIFSGSWNQELKFDCVDNVQVTRNDFQGSSDHVVEITAGSSGFKYFSDNKVTGKYGNVGVPITSGAGPK